MNLYSTRHLHWVLCAVLLLDVAGGEDGLAKTEKRMVFRSESGPRGESLQRSFSSTRVFSSSTSTSSATKPPDDRQSTSTSRLRNDTTVDLSRNTVPVLRSTLEGGKYRRTTTALPEGGGVKKSLIGGKPKRNHLGGVTRPRPADLTTLLAFNALSPRQQQLPYPSTTQVAESMPPTAWALASLKGPSTRRPGQIKPFVSWSTRLNKPTTPAATTELMESSTGVGETTLATDIISDLTAEGVDNTATPPMPNNSSNVSTLHPSNPLQKEVAQNETLSQTTQNISTQNEPTLNETNFKESSQTQTQAIQVESANNETIKNEPDLNETILKESTPQAMVNETKQNDSNDDKNILKESTQNETIQKELTQNETIHKESSQNETFQKKFTQNDTFLKESAQNETALEESSSNESTQIEPIQNITTHSDPIQTNNEKSQDITFYKPEENTISVPPLALLKNSSLNDLIKKKDITANAQFVSDHETDFSHEASLESLLKTDSMLQNSESDKLNETQKVAYTSETPELRERSNSMIFPSSPESEVPSSSSIPYHPTINDTYESAPNIQTSSESSSYHLMHSNINDSTVGSTNLPTFNDETETMKMSEESKFSEKTSTETDDLASEVTIRRYDNPENVTLPEVDPSINIINEKKSEDSVSTSTVVSAVNSTVTMHVASALTTPGNINLTNLVEEGKPEDQVEFAKHLPLTAETTTTAKPLTSTPLTDLIKGISNHKVHDPVIINQTINDIKPIHDIKPIPISLDGNIETTSARSNEIKHEIVKNDSSKEVNNKSNYMPDLPETTQSNYIQVHEVIKPQNKTVLPHFKLSEEVTERPSAPETTAPITTMRTTMSTEILPLFNVSTTTFSPTMSSEQPTTMNESISVSHTTVTTPLPVTTTPLSTTTIVPTTMVSMTTLPPNSPTTPKSNDVKEQEQLPIPEQNMTQFQYTSPNVVKNETAPVIIQEPDFDIDEEDGTFNNTDLDKKPNDHINNGDSEEDDDVNFHDILGNTTIPLNEKNASKEVPIIPTVAPTLLPTTSKPTSTTPNMDEVTQIDEEPPNIDDDTVYDTAVIMSVYIRILFEANHSEMCREKDQLRDAIVKIFKKYAERTIDKRQVQLLNLSLRDCTGLRGEIDQGPTPVQLYLTDQQGQYDKALNDIFLSLARQNQLEFKYPITHIEKVIGQHELTMDTDSSPSGTVVAAIIISSIAAVCLFALTILLVIMRKRQSGFNYGQRCTPVSLDDYSLDNISVYNSVRRKAMRASKRSYGNPAFDDPDVVSNPVNFAGLANMASSKSKTDEEFSNLPTVVVKADELPPGAENKNRYANVIPLPETRVPLQGGTTLAEQFINANYVKGAKGAEKCYIACQAPMQNTIEDFWKMVWDEQCRLIIMLTALSENGVEKCADYLPPSEVLDCHRVFGDLQVTLKKREAREKYVIASLQLKNLETNLWREVTHMWYAGWPPTGVPPEPSSVIAFLIEARSYSKGAPTVVHCSPGTGRTGTVISIDIAIRDFEAGRSVDIPKTVIQVRRGRAGAVQTKEQYHFIYKVLHLYATKLTGGGLDSI